MTNTIAKLILAMLLLPVTGAVFVIGFAATVSARGPTFGGLAIVWAVVYSFVGIYWMLLWRDTVRWTNRRIALTLSGTFASLLAGCLMGIGSIALNPQLPLPIATLVGGGGVPIFWVLLTVLIWRESPRERLERLEALGAANVTCPICGYSMAGLYEPRCPECGTRFTLEQFVAAQKASTAEHRTEI